MIINTDRKRMKGHLYKTKKIIHRPNKNYKRARVLKIRQNYNFNLVDNRGLNASHIRFAHCTRRVPLPDFQFSMHESYPSAF